MNLDTPLRWRCREGHEWLARPDAVVNAGTWCPRCAHVAPPTLGEIRALATAREGKLLSRGYFASDQPLRWRCHMGHEFSAPYQRRGSWCRSCCQRYRGSLDGMRLLATDRGGRCLAAVYDHSRVLRPWRCARGHRFELTGGAAKSGAWCPRCRDKARRQPGSRT